MIAKQLRLSRFILFVLLIVVSLALAGCATTEEESTEEPAPTSLLDEVKERGVLRCGIHPELAGFSFIDASGVNQGFDVSFCRAIATAIFADPTKVEFVQLNADQRFPALQGGEIDVLIRNTTWTLTRDADLGLDFTVTNFYDGQGYLVRAGEFTSVEELDGATVCVQSGTTTELNLADDFDGRGLTYTPNVFAEAADTFAAFFGGQCDAATSDKSQLAAQVSTQTNPEEFAILPDTISKEPLGPVVRANDSDWRDVVAWTVYAMLQAEEMGISRANVDDFLTSDDATVQRLLGTGEEDLGALLGLPKDWAYQVIKQVGNYGDVYEQYLTPIGISREGSLNALWTEGGLMYSPAYR
jgi:general L-amino acid transport system substrate-binding protein